MDFYEKQAAYQNLIDQVREAYQTQPGGLKWCDDCKEINLWTYWQGRGNLDARIMLVGQDWGCPWDEDAETVMETIRRINAGEKIPYMCGNTSPTDQNLVCLFQEIGYDISCTDNKDLFFTNFVLGYRANGCSGGFQKKLGKARCAIFCPFG